MIRPPVVVFLTLTSLLAHQVALEAGSLGGLLRTVAITGDQAPSALPGVEFASIFGDVALNENGEVAFRTTLGRDGVGFSNGNAIYSDGGQAGLRLVARTGEQVPGLPSGVLFGSNFANPNLNTTGQVAFENQLAGVDVTNRTSRAIFVGSEAGGLDLVARGGDPVPGMPGFDYGFYLGGNLLNSSGVVGFVADVLGPGTTSRNLGALFTKETGRPARLIVREGDAIPGSLPGEGVDVFFGTVLNESGHLAFSTILDGGIPEQRAVVRQVDASTVEVVARTGDPAPGQSPGQTYGLVGPPGFNSRGETAFLTVIGTRDGVTYGDSDGVASLIALEDDLAPGQPAGVRYQSFNQVGDQMVINSKGDIAFRARLDGFEDPLFRPSAIFVHSEGVTKPILSGGDPLPDRPSLTYSDTLTPPAINAAGQVALLATLRGPDVGASLNRAIVGLDRSGQLRTVVREGDAIDVSNDPGDPDLRILQSISFHGGYGNDDGRASAFNDLGQIAFIARFTDGSSGVFVSDVLTIPEPDAAAVAAWGFLAICQRRRRTEGSTSHPPSRL